MCSILMLTGIGIAQDEVVRLSEPVETGENYEVFGSTFDSDAKPLSLTDLIEQSEKLEGQKVVADGTIKQVCQKKGCFFMLDDGEHQVRITFKDYSFFIPSNTAGDYVKIAGTFNVKELSEEKAKHYAEDAEEDPEAINGPQKEYNLVATSVKIVEMDS
jgi:predicted RNA-binding protein with TRAM domain